MGIAAAKAADFAASIPEDANEFERRLANDASDFANSIEILSTPPSKPIFIANEEYRETAEQMYEDLDTGAINIGILGGEGTGKLSLIHALLQQPRAAAVPIAGEDEGKVATQFVDSTFSHIRFWYLPDDYMEENTPNADYFVERCLYAFDIILILVTNKIRPGDIELAKQANTFDPATPFAFIRSKIDGSMITGIGRVTDRNHWDHEKEKISNRIRSMLRKQLDEAGLVDCPLFLISQAGILDVNGKVPNDHRYVMDDYQFYNFLIQNIHDKRYSD